MEFLLKWVFRFGKKSIENYQNDVSLFDCIPEKNYNEWIRIDPSKLTIEIKLK